MQGKLHGDVQRAWRQLSSFKALNPVFICIVSLLLLHQALAAQSERTGPQPAGGGRVHTSPVHVAANLNPNVPSSHPSTPHQQPSTFDAHEQALLEAYGEATAMIKRALASVSTVNLSDNSMQSIDNAVLAVQAAETYLRDWGLSLLTQLHYLETNNASTHGDAPPHQTLKLVKQRGLQGLQQTVHRLRQLLPQHKASDKVKQPSDTPHLESADKAQACNAFVDHNAHEQSTSTAIQQSMMCLEHLIAALEEAQVVHPPIASGFADDDTPAAAPSLLSKIWMRPTGRANSMFQRRTAHAQQPFGETLERSPRHQQQASDAVDGWKAAAAERDDHVSHGKASHQHAADLQHHIHSTVHAAAGVPSKVQATAAEGIQQVAYTAGFLAEASLDAAHRVLHPLASVGKGSGVAQPQVSAATVPAGEATHPGAADALVAEHVTTPHPSLTTSSRPDQSLPVAGAAGKSFAGVQHSLHSNISNIKRILGALRKLPSWRHGTVLQTRRQDGAAAERAAHRAPPGGDSDAAVLLTVTGSDGTAAAVSDSQQALQLVEALRQAVDALQVVTVEFFVLAARQVHSRRLDALEASMQHSLHIMRLSEAELVELYGLPTAQGSMQATEVMWHGVASHGHRRVQETVQQAVEKLHAVEKVAHAAHVSRSTESEQMQKAVLDQLLHNSTKWAQDQLPVTPTGALPSPAQGQTGSSLARHWAPGHADHTSRLSAALLGARHQGQYGDWMWMAATPEDLHVAPQTPGQTLANIFAAARNLIVRSSTSLPHYLLGRSKSAFSSNTTALQAPLPVARQPPSTAPDKLQQVPLFEADAHKDGQAAQQSGGGPGGTSTHATEHKYQGLTVDATAEHDKLQPKQAASAFNIKSHLINWMRIGPFQHRQAHADKELLSNTRQNSPTSDPAAADADTPRILTAGDAVPSDLHTTPQRLQQTDTTRAAPNNPSLRGTAQKSTTTRHLQQLLRQEQQVRKLQQELQDLLVQRLQSAQHQQAQSWMVLLQLEDALTALWQPDTGVMQQPQPHTQKRQWFSFFSTRHNSKGAAQQHVDPAVSVRTAPAGRESRDEMLSSVAAALHLLQHDVDAQRARTTASAVHDKPREGIAGLIMHTATSAGHDASKLLSDRVRAAAGVTESAALAGMRAAEENTARPDKRTCTTHAITHAGRDHQTSEHNAQREASTQVRMTP